MDYYYLFDMDGTLLFTDDLNNDSYNAVLKSNDLKPITSNKRVTREVIRNFFPEIAEQKMVELIDQKQEYFIDNISQVRTNEYLFDILRRFERERCILWTSADRRRAESMIDKFDLENFFEGIIFSEKKQIAEDISHICSEFACENEQILVFENDASIARALSENHVSCFLFVSPLGN